jgi:hypothetical protein
MCPIEIREQWSWNRRFRSIRTGTVMLLSRKAAIPRVITGGMQEQALETRAS